MAEDRQPKPDGFVKGYEEAERRFITEWAGAYRPEMFDNPFPEGSDEYRGFEDGVYDFTQK